MDTLKLVNAEMERLQTARAAQSTPKPPADVDGNRVVSLTQFEGAAYLSPFTINERGYRLHMLKAGSDPNALKIDLGKAGVYGPVYPGVEIVVPGGFDRIAVSRWQNDDVPVAGALTARGGTGTMGSQVTLAIAKSPDAKCLEPVGDGGFVYQRNSSQAYNSLANIPTAATDGVSIRGARSIRAAVYTELGDNVAGGTIYWWWRNPAIGTWCLTDLIQPLPTGVQYVSPSELPIELKGGRLFPEVRSYTGDSAISATVRCRMFVFGEGSDIGIGDLST